MVIPNVSLGCMPSILKILPKETKKRKYTTIFIRYGFIFSNIN